MVEGGVNGEPFYFNSSGLWYVLNEAFNNCGLLDIRLDKSFSTFRGTLNGVQIKTWPDPTAAGGRRVRLEYNLREHRDGGCGESDQQYCPFDLCSDEGSSKIEIRNVTFRNIWGTCSRSDAVKLECSESNPCHDIALENITLIGPDGFASSSCSSVHGRSTGPQKPPSCLH